MKGTKRKYQLLSILLSLMLVVGLMPAMSTIAFAVTPGINLTASTANSSSAGWSYEKDTKTLTLNGYDGDYIKASGIDELNLVLKDGTNNIINTSDETNFVYGIYSSGNINICGSGSLTINVSGSNGGDGIYCHAGKITVESDAKVTINITNNGSLAMEGILSYGNDNSVADNGKIHLKGTVNINCNKIGTGDIYGIYCGGKDGNICISSGSVTVTNADIGIRGGSGTHSEAFSDIRISGGEVCITSSGNYGQGIYSGGNGVEISGGTVTVSTDSYALRLRDNFSGYRTGLVKITGSAKVSLTTECYRTLYVEYDADETSTRVHVIDLSSGGSFTVKSNSNQDNDFVIHPVRGYFKLGSNTEFVKGLFSDSTNTNGGQLFEADSTAKLVKVAYKNYTVSFNANGGTGTMASLEVPAGSYKLPECTFIPPEGKVFKAWSRTTGISGYISNGILNLTGDITVYPIWGDPRLDVTDGTAKDGDGNYVSTNDSNRSVAAGTEITITANGAPEDYAFDKWEAVSGNVTFADATSQVTTFVMPGENVEVKATYKHVNHSYGSWESDGTNHWKECTCGYRTDAEAHSYNSVVTAKATTSKNGTVEKECSVCGYRTTETIYYPKTMKLSTTNYTYSGGVKTPTVSIIDSNGKTVSSANYSVSYASGRKSVGKYKVTVTFKGDKYSGSKYTYFYINPKGTSISKVSGAKKAFTVKWKKQSSKMATSTITGYQIRYSTSSKMTSAKTKTVKGYKYTSKKITKLSAKKKYYVQVRTYKTVSGKTYYSSWSSVKSVKTK